MYASIDVDFDVFKEITRRRATQDVTPNDVLRDILGLEPKKAEDVQELSKGRPWVTKGVTFPHGTEFRAFYKGEVFHAVVDDGALKLNLKRFYSPSKAAISITNNSVNGWTFWQCKMPGRQGWSVIKSFRKD